MNIINKMFDYFKKTDIEEPLVYPADFDHLEEANKYKNIAQLLIKKQDYNAAWDNLSKQKEHYLLYSSKNNSNEKQALDLDSSIHEDYARILKYENKHKHALVNIIYYLSSSEKTNSNKEKLQTYFEEAKLKNISYKQVENYTFQARITINYNKIEKTFEKWC